MITTNNTVLVTGGGSGIGFETARLLSEKNNTVIITGRSENRLKQAVLQLKNTHYIVNDVTDPQAVDQLTTRLQHEFPGLNMLVNNAGKAYAYQLSGEADAHDKAADEMNTNYLSIVRLTERLLPQLSRQKEAAIINISSVVAFLPWLPLPTYSASKAALHSYTQILRLSLESNFSPVKVFEVMPPLVDTAFAKELTGQKISPAEVATAILDGIENGVFEIKVGMTADLYQLFLSSPGQALRTLNGIK